MNEDDVVYYRIRMRLESDLALRASHPNVAQAHLALALLYRDRIEARQPNAGAARPLTRATAARRVH